MTALDQAFIKAYAQQGVAPTTPLDRAQSASPAHAAEDRPPDQFGDAPATIPIDSLPAASQKAAPPVEELGLPCGVLRLDQSFRPMLQVDHFTWPNVCRRLSKTAADQLDRLSDGLEAAMAQEHKVLAICGCQRGEGATTLLLCAGRRLAKRGLKVVMVDANLVDPQLARRLGLLPEFGWEEVLAGRLPLEEVVIESVHNQLAVLPLREPFAGTDRPTEDERRLADNIETLAAYYDLVLLDLGPLEDPNVVGGWLARGLGSRLDAIALVHNVRDTARERLAEIQRCLAATDIAQAGIIENFAAA